MNRAKAVLWTIVGAAVVTLLIHEVNYLLGSSAHLSSPPPPSVLIDPNPPPPPPKPTTPSPTLPRDLAGKMSTHPVTIVSGLWNVRSKRPFSTYAVWAKNFLSLDAHMVLFIDPTIRAQIEPLRPAAYRNRTLWVDTTLEDFWTARYRPTFEEHWKIDHERGYHTPELYMIWAEKAPMLKRAIGLNPFNSSCFYWTDFGCFRDDPKKCACVFVCVCVVHTHTILLTLTRTPWTDLHWPGAERCEEDPRVILLKIRDFEQSEIERFRSVELQRDAFTKPASVGGGIYGGRWDYVLKFHDAYFAMLERFAAKKYFIGKDQTILVCVAYNHPDLVNLIGPSKDNPWFYLEDYLLPQSAT